MKQIPATIVAELCREISERASLSAAMDYLKARQPDILRYLMLESMDGHYSLG